jgi:aspartyl-tRNA(Asn)/glutamyl-tRNA(Gln) amidotransferase subunit C
MPVSLKDVEHIARLARLEFSEAEKEKLTHQLNEILMYVEQLNKVDTSNVEPLAHVIELGNRFRQDVVQPGLTSDEALKNAPDRADKFFKVPKVIGGEKKKNE